MIKMSPYRLDSTFEQALITWINTELTADSVTAMWDKQDAMGSRKALKPAYPYASIGYVSGPTKVGRADKVFKTTDTWTMIHHQVFVLNITIINKNDDGYLDMMRRLHNSLEKEGVLAAFKTAGISFQDTILQPTDISELLEAGHDFRSTMDLQFGYKTQVDDAMGEVRSTEISRDINEGDHIGTQTIP